MNIPEKNAEQFLSRTDLCSKEEAIDYAKKSGINHKVWGAVFTRSDVLEYILKTLSVREVITFVMKMDRIYSFNEMWKPILGRKDLQEYLSKTLPHFDAVDYAKTCDHWRIWEIVAVRNDLLEYLLKTLSPVDAILYAKKINNFYLFAIVLSRTDIAPREVIACAKEVKYDNSIWEIVFNRKDVEEYLLNTLSPLEAIEYAKEINYWRVWNFIFEKKKDLPFKEAVVAYSTKEIQKGYGGDFDSLGQLQFGVNRMWHYLEDTLSLAEAIAFAKEVKHPDVWKVVLQRKDITAEESITHAKEIINKDIWEIVLKRDDISKERAIACAKEIDDPKVWDIVLEKK